MAAKTALQALTWLVYPLAILFGLRVAEPRYVALALAAALLLRRNREAMRLLASLSRVELAVLGGLLALAGRRSSPTANRCCVSTRQR